PMCLRANIRRQGPENYAARLREAGMEARLLGGGALLLEKPVPVERLPGFRDGDVSVQDAGAQRAAACLDLSAGVRVLDACAAPGGKSAHVLELADVRLTALDADAERCARLTANLSRLALSAEQVKTADCTRLESWWDGTRFDRILADVPCTASGVARRHPDLKWLRRAEDVGAFAAKQKAILAALWQVLAPGGKLLYVTCSVFPGENEDVVGAFIASAENALRLPLPDGQPSQWLPCAEHDGFFLALIQKQA
ncbi:MAG: 16S rRNA (cytosine(967)-C(5))-methyltransferase RsmB, partial [Clostridia bacterium]